MSTLEMVNKTTLTSINLLNNHSNNLHETTIVTAVALAFVILALVVFLGILFLWKVQCKRCSNHQSEENPQQFTEVYIGDFVPHAVSEDDHTTRAPSYVNTAATGVHTPQTNCTMTDKRDENHSKIRSQLRHDNLNDEINDNIFYQEVESNNVYSEAGSFDVYLEAGSLNVYTEAGPLNVYTETESLNVYSDVELNSLQQDTEHSHKNPYHNIEGYSEASITDKEDVDAQLTTDSDNNDDRENIYVNSNKTMESSSSESDLFPETAADCEDASTSVYDIPPNNSLYRTSFA